MLYIKLLNIKTVIPVTLQNVMNTSARYINLSNKIIAHVFTSYDLLMAASMWYEYSHTSLCLMLKYGHFFNLSAENVVYHFELDWDLLNLNEVWCRLIREYTLRKVYKFRLIGYIDFCAQINNKMDYKNTL